MPLISCLAVLRIISHMHTLLTLLTHASARFLVMPNCMCKDAISASQHHPYITHTVELRCVYQEMQGQQLDSCTLLCVMTTELKQMWQLIPAWLSCASSHTCRHCSHMPQAQGCVFALFLFSAVNPACGRFEVQHA